MDKIKVLQVCYSLKAAGIETFVNNLQRYIDRNEIDNHFLVYKYGGLDSFYEDQITANGGVIENASSVCKSFLERHLRQRIKYCKIVRKGCYDIVHIHASSGLQGLEVMLAKLMGAKKIIVHSHSSNLSLSSKLYWLKKIMHKIGLIWINKFADYRFACSQKASDWLFYDGRSEIIINGISVSDYKFNEITRKKVREQLGVERKFVIGHIGTFSKIKNHVFLLKIFKEYLKTNSDSILVLIGTGSLVEDTKKIVKKLKLTDKVLFLGVRDDCNELLMGMDCFVFPSLWEGMPITLIEAQVSGLNCLLSDTITREVDINNQMKFLSLDSTEKKWAKMITPTKIDDRLKYFEKFKNSDFNMENTSRKIVKIYRQLVKG